MSEYEEGKEAFWQGDSILANPYKFQKSIEWKHGWLAAQEIEHAIENSHDVG